jgi:hypothetical protein
MKKENLFSLVSEKVSEVTGIGIPQMLSSTTEECTDARYLLIRALSALDFTDIDIARHIGRSRQAVGYLRSKYKKSRKWTIANDWQSLRKWIENTFLNSK